jgi:hypothetical protein
VKKLLLLLLMMCSVGIAVSGGAPERETLAVIVGKQNLCHPAVIATIQAEVERVLATPGLNVVWRRLESLHSSESFDHLVVVRFEGSCDASGFPDLDRREPALGLTHVSDGDVLPFAEVKCARVLRLVAPLLELRGSYESHALVGRALARVLAHELYHVLAKTTRHGRSGIAKPVLSAEELLCPNLDFAASDLSAIRKTLLRARYSLRAGKTAD